ncbi:MAG: tRNA (adenosine(37)-N6)-dimethylallyltransferase MiaA [Xanthobacteraceae bacterium]
MSATAASKRVVLIAGPTASGKSALALALAQELGGTIINADSMQVYRDLRIITARPGPSEEALVPHRLYGHVDASENYSAGRWCREAAQTLMQLGDSLPIIVGGTGLYFKALTTGLSSIPPVPSELRVSLRDRLCREGISRLYADLRDRDPVMANRLMPGDRARVVRALEVMLATGRSLADWHAFGMKPLIDVRGTLRVFLDVDRNELYRRINARFDAMLASGALEEVEALRLRHLDPQPPTLKAHGVPWLMRHLQGEIDLATAVEAAKRDTRRYTRRQATWFRHQLPDWTWVASEKAADVIRRALSR